MTGSAIKVLSMELVPPDDENPVKKQIVGDYLRANSAWIWAKSVP